MIIMRSFQALTLGLLLVQGKPQDIGRLLEDLGSDSIEKRESASFALRELGEKARSALEDAKGSKDPELAGRVGDLLSELSPGGKLRRIQELSNGLSKGRIQFKTTATYPKAKTVTQVQVEGSLWIDDAGKLSISYGLKGAPNPLTKAIDFNTRILKAMVVIGSIPTLEICFDTRERGLGDEAFATFEASITTASIAFGKADSVGDVLNYTLEYRADYDPIVPRGEVFKGTVKLWYEKRTNRLLQRELRSDDVVITESYSQWNVGTR
jgi:hypothetical protein